MVVASVAALLAAALFALATALQHRSAGLVPDAGARGSGRLIAFILGTLRHPLWIMGTLADVGGFGLHALALRYGPLTLVQPLLVSTLVFALVLRQLLEHRRPGRNELAWASALAVGLILFLAIVTPGAGVAQPASTVPTVLMSTLIGLGIAGFFIAGRRRTGSAAAALLGTATGLSYAGAAGLLKQDMGTLDRGVGALATSWSLYALIALGGFSLLLNQLAYQAGPLRASLPTIMTGDPIFSLVIGVAVFDEHFRSGPADLLGELIGLVLVVGAAVGLTRSGPGAGTGTSHSPEGGPPSGVGSSPYRGFAAAHGPQVELPARPVTPRS